MLILSRRDMCCLDGRTEKDSVIEMSKTVPGAIRETLSDEALERTFAGGYVR